MLFDLFIYFKLSELNQFFSFDLSQTKREDKRAQAGQVLGSAAVTKPYQLFLQPFSITVSGGGGYAHGGDRSICSQR